MHSISALFQNYCLISVAWGMPSAHSATVAALAVSSAWQFGFASFQFAISVLLATIVMSDAMGVRFETGKQAKIINEIVIELFSGKGDTNANLKELIGHTPFQVLVGAILGIIVPIVLKLTVYS